MPKITRPIKFNQMLNTYTIKVPIYLLSDTCAQIDPIAVWKTTTLPLFHAVMVMGITMQTGTNRSIAVIRLDEHRCTIRLSEAITITVSRMVTGRYSLQRKLGTWRPMTRRKDTCRYRLDILMQNIHYIHRTR